METIAMEGRKFWRLTIISRSARQGREAAWNCVCGCGSKVIVRGSRLRSGETASCGCGRRAAVTTHGLSRHPLYEVWRHMMRRCSDPNDKDWRSYGGRGIRVCRRWANGPQAFIADMGGDYRPGLTLERNDNDGNYSLDNCTWATPRQQALNRRRSRKNRAQHPEFSIQPGLRRRTRSTP